MGSQVGVRAPPADGHGEHDDGRSGAGHGCPRLVSGCEPDLARHNRSGLSGCVLRLPEVLHGRGSLTTMITTSDTRSSWVGTARTGRSCRALRPTTRAISTVSLVPPSPSVSR